MECVVRERNEGESRLERDINEVRVSIFEDSPEKFISTMESISLLCGEKDEPFDKHELQRMSHMITFLKEWRHFLYEPKIINFTYETGSQQLKEEIRGVNLPQFSSAAPPDRGQSSGTTGTIERKDFLLHAGGSVSAMDWSPRTDPVLHTPARCEYLAVAAHPPGSSYHKIGARLTGRGIIQIWVILDICGKVDHGSQSSKERSKNESSRRSGCLNTMSEVPLKTRGRPRKIPLSVALLDDSHNGLNSNSRKRGRPRKVPISAESLNDSSVGNDIVLSMRPRGRPRKNPRNAETANQRDISEELNMGTLVPDEYLNGNKNIKNTILSPCGADNNLNGKLDSNPCKKRGRPRKNPVRLEDTCTEVAKVLKTKSSSPKTFRGRAKMIPDEKSEADQKALPSAASNGVVSCFSEDAYANSYDHIPQECQIDEGIPCIKIGNSEVDGNSKAIVASENNRFGIYPPLSMIDKETIGGEISVSVSKEPTDINDTVSLSTQEDVALPRVVLCLGHGGKVAWDVKWRPFIKDDEIIRHRLGYLAAVLGNGSLEVWEIPCPSIIKNIYKSSFKEGTDPRFVKLRPVFKCSEVKCGNRQSIPLTLEWSRSTSDLILVGCHDGTVALWKFSANDSIQDTRPLLCFAADNVPIRSVSWAPGESYSQSSNVVVTAGHEGIKFWDIRDPYRPLWDFNPAQKMILSLDWSQHPSCLVFSFDDGTIKTLSLSKAACNVHVTGKPFDGAKHGVVHNYYRSHFAVWSVHVSPLTGVAAYCCADGSTFCFQITEKSVDKVRSRYSLPHYLCGALQGTGPTSLTVSTPLPHTAIPDLPRRARGVPPHSSFRTLEKGEEGLEDQDNPELDQPVKNKKSSKKALIKSQTKEETLLEEDFLEFPPKIVAMHRVRWNTNPGSKRWLCSGGAAGIIRCQVINLQRS